jgi:uncharacterized protein (TIGR02271 family)
MSITDTDAARLVGSTLHGTDGKIGRIGQVFLDDTTGRPEWVTVHTGLFGTNESFVPIEAADTHEDGLRVPYDKETVKNAPNVDVDAGHLSEDEERRLFAHYGRDYDAGYAGYAAADVDRDVDTTGRTHGAGHDTSGPETDDAMTRSEEQLSVGTETREAGRARLRKHIVTEQQTVNVPVQREEVRLEREPITDANVGAAMSGPDLSEEEHEVVLHEEQVVVEKKAVPVERVRLGTETVTEERSVTEDVRKEQIEADGVADADRRI